MLDITNINCRSREPSEGAVIEVTPNDEFYPVILVAWIEKGRTLAEQVLHYATVRFGHQG